jgi:WD40 repeat protein
MNIKKLFITIILILIPSTVSSTQASILEALRAGIPPIIVASEIDKLIQDEPNCSTANFLRSILQNYPNNKPIIYRIARRFHQLNCEEHADALKHTLLQQAEQLSIIQSVNKLLNSLTDKKAIPTFVLQVQEGFYLKTGGLFRAALSPSKRYLSVSQIEEKGAIKIWDLKTGYFVSSLSENFTIISTFINDRYLLLASQIGIQVWDIIENKKELLSINLVSIPSFLERSSDGKHIAINNLKGEVTIYEINAHAPFKLKRKQIVSIAQVAKFVDNKTLLLGNEGGKFCLYDIELSSTGCDFSVKTSEHFELEIMRTLKVRSQIAVSEDGQRYAILINKQLALVERHNGQLKLIKTLKKPEPIHAAVFTAKHLVVLTDSQLLYFNFEGELLANSPIKNAKWMQKVGESSVVLIGDDFFINI